MKKYLLGTSEIILKGKNRHYFERIFINNLKAKIGFKLEKIENWGGMFYLEAKEDVLEDLKKVFGVKTIKEVEEVKTLEEIIDFLKAKIERGFRLDFEVKRSDKDYSLNSFEIKQKIINELKNYFVIDFKKPERIVYILYKKKKFWVSFEKYFGLDGLPVGSSGKGIVLLSAGFDSPVASFLSMKRGLKLYFVHFHSYPQTGLNSLEKVKKLVRILNEYNLGSKLFFLNILELQKFYFLNVPKKFLVIFYRRSMFRLAERIKEEISADVLITGESLGQVASQTIKNLKVIDEAVTSLVLRPLITFNKEEIIELAKKIGTAEISKEPYDDCCSLFIPHRVETHANLEKILKIENEIKDRIKELEDEIYKNKEIIVYN